MKPLQGTQMKTIICVTKSEYRRTYHYSDGTSKTIIVDGHGNYIKTLKEKA
jgi:hypothetical protein